MIRIVSRPGECVIFGTAASAKPDPTIEDGYGFFELDTGKVFHAASGQWVQTGGAGSAGMVPVNSPTFTGSPTGPTATLGSNTTQFATTAFVNNAIANLVNASPAALDTLAELAAAMGNDANFAASMTTALAGKQPLDSDLTAIAALSTTAFGRSLLALADASAARTLLTLGTLATQSGTFSGSSSGTNTGDQAITLTGDVTGNGTGSFATAIGAGRVTQTMLANDGTGATPATTGAMTVPMTRSVVTITPTGNCTFNASGGAAGKRVSFVVTTVGVVSFTMTFGTNFKAVSTLVTGTATARTFCVTFACTNGTQWVEMSRTASIP